MGQNPFATIIRWYINGVSLDIEDKLTYLGSILGGNRGKKHCENHCRAEHHSFYGLQGARIKSPGVNPQTALHLFNVGVSSTLTRCASIYTLIKLVNLDKYQVKLKKQCLGLKCRTCTTALMKALGIEYISGTIKQSSLDLLKVCLLNNSMMQKFYCMLMNEPTVRQVASKTLYGRVSSYCHDKGIIDSIRGLLTNYDITSQFLLNNLLKAF